MKLKLYGDHYIHIPQIIHQTIQDEVDQVMILTTLLDINVITRSNKDSIYQQTCFYINDLSILIETERDSNNKITYIELEKTLQPGKYQTIFIYKRDSIDNPYKVLYDSFLYIKNTL